MKLKDARNLIETVVLNANIELDKLYKEFKSKIEKVGGEDAMMWGNLLQAVDDEAVQNILKEMIERFGKSTVTMPDDIKYMEAAFPRFCCVVFTDSPSFEFDQGFPYLLLSDELWVGPTAMERTVFQSLHIGRTDFIWRPATDKEIHRAVHAFSRSDIDEIEALRGMEAAGEVLS
jgi:hypothetical protein